MRTSDSADRSARQLSCRRCIRLGAPGLLRSRDRAANKTSYLEGQVLAVEGVEYLLLKFDISLLAEVEIFHVSECPCPGIGDAVIRPTSRIVSKGRLEGRGIDPVCDLLSFGTVPAKMRVADHIASAYHSGYEVLGVLYCWSVLEGHEMGGGRPSSSSALKLPLNLRRQKCCRRCPHDSATLFLAQPAVRG